MTCIVGLVQNKKLWIGGDSAGSDGYDIQIRKDEKVFENGPFLIGFTSSFRMGQLLRWTFKPPKHPRRMADEKFMSTIFVDAVRKCLKDGGYARTQNNQETGGTFIIGYKRVLYMMENDYQIGLVDDEYMTCGSGQSIATGCLFGTRGTADPKNRVELALMAAERYTSTVRGPYTIMTQ